MHSSFILAALVAAAYAMPAATNPKTTTTTTTTTTKSISTTSTTTKSSMSATATCKTQSQDANFDDLTGVPGNQLNPIPMGYKGLYFQGFTFTTGVNAGTGVQPGLLPHSPPNYATSFVVTTTTAGSAEWTTNYQSSTVKSFTPQSFYYGCVLNGQTGAAAAPQACNVAITGFRTGDDTAEAVQVAAQEFSYNPTTALGAQQLAFGTFNAAFANVQYVLIQYTVPGGQAALQSNLAFFVDDVVFTTCS